MTEHELICYLFTLCSHFHAVMNILHSYELIPITVIRKVYQLRTIEIITELLGAYCLRTDVLFL